MLFQIAFVVVLKWCPTLQNKLMQRYKVKSGNMRRILDLRCFKHLL